MSLRLALIKVYFLVMNSKRCKGVTHINNRKFTTMTLLSIQLYCSARLEINQSCHVQTPRAKKEISAPPKKLQQSSSWSSKSTAASPTRVFYSLPFLFSSCLLFSTMASSTIIFTLAFLCCISFVPVPNL